MADSGLVIAGLKCPHCKTTIADRSIKKVYGGGDVRLVYHEPCKYVLGVIPDKVKVEN